MKENIVWHNNKISQEQRENYLGQKGVLLWLTGLSGSGKSTVAVELESQLMNENHFPYILDGDNIRHGLNSDLRFDPQSRIENIRRVGEVGKLLVDIGIITISAFISPYEADRNRIRNGLGERFIEIYVNCPLDVCKERDPKGLYKKAEQGIITNLTGMSDKAPYQPPKNPEITIHTDKQTIQECATTIISYLNDNKYLKQ